MEKLANVSAEAVKKATGRSWDEWVELLDREGTRALSHKELAKMLEGYSLNGWWSQMIAVGYEQAHGKRVKGQTAKGFQAGVRKTFPLNVQQAWELITSPKGVECWLGVRGGLDFKKGEPYRTVEDVTGNIRVVRKQSHLRLTWQPPEWENHSSLQIRIIPGGKKSAISFHHEGLPGEKERERMRKYWKGILEQLLKK